MSSKLEASVELKSSALSIFEIFASKLYDIPSIDPDFIQSSEIVSGEWGSLGFVALARYTLDGKASVIKAESESIDLVNISSTFNTVEGDLLDEYKSIKFTSKVTPNILSGCIVHWTIEYVKLNDDTSDPTSMLNALVQLSKNVDAYIANII